MKEIPEIYIRAVNPGYTVDKVNNVGEMIEIARNATDTPISLTGFSIDYTNSSGNTVTLYEFPENSWMVGDNLLLRLASSPGSELAVANYSKTLAFKAGPLVLRRGGEILDSVCWNGEEGCAEEFKSSSPTFLVRDLETGEFKHLTEYEVTYDEKNYYEEPVTNEGFGEVGKCKGLIVNEVLSYYENSRDEQFIEIYNSASEQILLDGCRLKYKNKYYGLTGILKPEGYMARYATDFSLTKNPTSSNKIEIVDVDGTVVDDISYPNGQRRGTSYALIGYDDKGESIWKNTYAPTPGEANNYQEFRTCEEGKVLNETTGNCVKVVSVKEKVCPAGQILNPLTGRCKKAVSISNSKSCKEGYYYNEETGRCKKIKENTGASYAIEPESYTENSSFIGLIAVIIVVIVGLIYIIYEFRGEIRKLWHKVFR